MEKSNSKNNNRELWQYAGMATQFLVAIGLGIFFGLKLDELLKWETPVFVWVFPLFIIIGIIIKIIKDTSKK